MRKRIALFLACFMMASLAIAQTRVTGTVISAEDGEPIPGASVLLEGTKTGVVTNVEGKFALTVPTNVKRLEVSCSGMIKQLVRVKPVINVEMQVDSKAMDEVMVVAYGTSTKQAFTGSATVVGAEQIETIQSTNALDALTGHVAGVELYSLTGNPANNNPSIRIRGVSSLSAGISPLIVVDGAPYGGDMNTINTADVESMTVLKDAAATSLYGARGANGVILITTKSGKRGDAKVTLDAKWGSNSRARREYKTVNSPAQYYEMYYGALNNYAQDKLGYTASQANQWANRNLTSNNNYGLGMNVYDVPAGQQLIGMNGKLNPNATLGRVDGDFMLLPDNWLDEAYHNGFRQEYNVNVSKSDEKGSFFASFGYINNEGITYNSSMENINGRLKADLQAKKWLKVGANVNYSHYNAQSMLADGTSNSSVNIFAVATQIAPIYPLYIRDANGNIKIDPKNGFRMHDWADGSNAGSVRPIFPGSNAIQAQQVDINRWEGNAMSATGFAEIRFAKDFKFTTQNTVNLDESRSTDLTNPYYGNYAGQNGILGKRHSRTLDYTFRQQLDWGHDFNKHDVSAMVGHEWYRKNYYTLSASRYNMFDPNNLELNGAVTDNSDAASYTTMYNNEAYFARAQYNYALRYFLSAQYRREASSRFSKDDGRWWGNFYSVSGAWVMSQEKFMQKAKWVDFLKLKLSYGEQGNDNIDSYLYTNRYSVVNSGGNPAVIPSSTKGNRDITWETVGELNGGLEFGLFKNRLTGSVEYFWRKTSDMLYDFSLPRSSGFGGYYDNVGDMVNHGIEVELNADVLRLQNFQWNLGLNLTHYKNEITFMPDEKKTATVYDFDGKEFKGYASGNMFLGENLSIGSFYMPKYAGVDPNTGESTWYYTKADGSKGVTTNYSDATDYVVSESLLPKLFGGFNTNFQLYGFELGVDFAYQLGGKIYDSPYATYMGSPTNNSRGDNFHADLLNAWSPTNTTSNIPRLQYGDQYTSSLSTRFLTNASYLSLQNLTFAYNLPTNVLRKAKIDGVKLYVNAANVWLWSKRQGLDPRTAATNFSYGTANATYYSTIRTISAGVKVTF
ncbi:MAG: SusC/RagA family TonB-linked outer membrane protein [Bacteroidaceae bacterium]|nr:SusC/RagA family TonB-linked outer membrane protein [Bacteroidaceae bacterium]